MSLDEEMISITDQKAAVLSQPLKRIEDSQTSSQHSFFTNYQKFRQVKNINEIKDINEEYQKNEIKKLQEHLQSIKKEYYEIQKEMKSVQKQLRSYNQQLNTIDLAIGTLEDKQISLKYQLKKIQTTEPQNAEAIQRAKKKLANHNQLVEREQSNKHLIQNKIQKKKARYNLLSLKMTRCQNHEKQLDEKQEKCKRSLMHFSDKRYVK